MGNMCGPPPPSSVPAEAKRRDIAGLDLLRELLQRSSAPTGAQVRRLGEELAAGRLEPGVDDLCTAASKAHWEVVIFLVEKAGVDWRAERDGACPLEWVRERADAKALRRRKSKTECYLAHLDENDGRPERELSLLAAYRFGDAEWLQAALNREGTSDGATQQLLIQAVHAADHSTVDMLLGRGVSLDVVGATPILMHAASSMPLARSGKQQDMMRRLAAAGAPVDAVDELGRSALMGAIEGQNLEAVKFLLVELGASADMTLADGQSVLEWARGLTSTVAHSPSERGAEGEQSTVGEEDILSAIVDLLETTRVGSSEQAVRKDEEADAEYVYATKDDSEEDEESGNEEDGEGVEPQASDGDDDAAGGQQQVEEEKEADVTA